ncbi:TIGR02186 family protein [Rubellimicrobium sp. CFH 75288]|uniref:TIGR02186 family protein n=1 Tax=Rubellimicrobium sp. CFH 75288 TaxID=2697034 RepID=UPI001412F233|nr:TIGR02186 family protein [Rubellimicrobium sp. CFH 75288]NAZ36637.1 hypothetical protein [Rubellimicrobium sp. CFH 75288]
MRRLALVLLLLLCALPAAAERIVLGLSEDQVALTATFDGRDILIFGAVRREEGPPPEAAPLNVIVTVSGPMRPLTVRRAERRFGIWINASAVRVDQAPSFYAVATTRPLSEILSDTEDLRHSISIPRAIRAVGNEVIDRDSYIEALIRIRTEEGSYQMLEGGVTFTEQTLFRTRVTLPATLTEGRYATRIFLTREGAVVDTFETAISVRKVGIERWLFNLSRREPVQYGVLALLIALAAGWAASAAFQALRG